MLPIAGFVNLAISPAHQAFEIAAGLRFAGETVQLGKASGGALVEIVSG